MPTLDWIGKRAVLNHHREVPFHLLKGVKSLSAGDPGSGNLLVQGDNLLALKALLPYYAGRVKCIYIDPPYNRGEQKWAYNDAVNSPEMRNWLGKVVGAEAEDLSRHDKWLCMMYPRLQLLRDFLRDDGAIVVSIDDTEVGHLRLVMDEVFGPRNFVANVIWQKKFSPQNDATWMSDSHDHLLVYARQKVAWRPNMLLRSLKQQGNYSNPDDDPRQDWTSADYTCNKTRWQRPNLYYAIKQPNTGEEIWPKETRVWAFGPDGHQKNVAEKRLWWGKSGTNRVPRLKIFASETEKGVVPQTLWLHEDVGNNQEAKRELEAFDLELSFPTPKPLRLIRRVLELGTDKDSLVLDSFAGSGTMGHAVLDLNRADGGKRRFIMVEMDESICRTITAQRLSHAIDGYTATKWRGKTEMLPV